MTARYPTKITWWIAPMLLLMGVTPGRCFTEVTAEEVHVRLGWLFDRRFPRGAVAEAIPTRIPWYCGPGVHVDLRGRVFVTGRYGEGVEIRFTSPQAAGWLYGRRCRQVVVTPKDSAGLLAALGAADGA